MAIQRCPNCGAILQLDTSKKIRYCEYCGTDFTIEDQTQTVRYIDEARLKEVELKERIFQAEQNEREETERTRQREKRNRILIMLLIVIGVFGGYASGNSFLGTVLVIGLIWYVSRGAKKNENRKERYNSYETYDDSEGFSDKSRMVALFLCFFLGYMGVHLFYVGRIKKGILYFFTVGLFGIGILIDLIRILQGKFTDSYGNYLV